ncbi:SDR family NAD(P)-dependent oxidoreductase [Streptomyces viridiviolaceus]
MHAVELDVTCQDSADTAVDRIFAERGRLDMVVHNAGHMVLGAAEAFTVEQFADLYDVNVLGAQRVNRAAPCRSCVSRTRDCWCGSAAQAPAAAAPRSWPRTSPPSRPRPRRLLPDRTGQSAHRRKLPVTPH